MIRPININLNAAHPELKLLETVTYTGSPSSVFIRGIPPNYGRWAITAVFVAASFPDGSTTTRAAVQSADGVWVATLPATATSGRTENGFRVIADGIDENGEAVTGYIIAVADFAVASLDVTPAPEPGETSYQMLYFDEVPSILRKGDVTKIDGVLKFYNGSAWEPFAAPVTLDDAVTRTSANGVKSSGIWSAIWGALSALPTGFTSLYDWCVAQLAGKMPSTATGADIAVSGTDATKINAALNGKATKADATLNLLSTPWSYDYDSPEINDVNITWDYADNPGKWTFIANGGEYVIHTSNSDELATSVTASYGSLGTITATRTVNGYRLGPSDGPNADKPLASEAEAEALRTALAGKANDNAVVKLTGDQSIAGNKRFEETTAFDQDVLVGDGALVVGTVGVDNTNFYTNGIRTYGHPAPIMYPAYNGLGNDFFALIQHIAPDYDSETSNTYAANELRSYQGAVYRCTTAHTATSWVAANWALATVEDVLAALRTGKLDSTSAAPAFSSDSSTQYPVGSHCTYNGKLYKCTTATTGGTWDASKWTADTMTDPDAVLDITSQNQLRVVAKDGTLLWAQGYDLASTSSATLACDAANNFTFADGATTQAFTLPTEPTGKVGDFGLDIDNSANTGAATMTLTGLDTAFSVVIPEGESLNDMLAIAAGELARFYVTLSTFRVNNLPTWHIVKQVVENGGAAA